MTDQELIEAWRHAFYVEDGKLRWKNPTSTKFKAGDEAGTLFTNQNGKQYRRVMFQGKHCYVHRVIFALVRGYLPETVDHIDGDGLNNYPENLRAATRQENARNIRSPLNTSGYTGVYWHKDRKKYAAQIYVNGRVKHLSYFDDPVEAARAYDKAALELHGGFATLNGV